MKYFSSPYNEKNDRAIFERVVILTIVLIILQFFSEFYTTVVTTGYFILPILYVLLKYNRTEVNILKKSLVHFVITICVTLSAFSDKSVLYESFNLLYLIGYIIAIYRNLNNPMNKSIGYEIYNFIGFYCFYIVAGSAVCLFYLVNDLLGRNYEVSSNFILGGFDFFAIIFSVLSLISSRANSRMNVSKINTVEDTNAVELKVNDEVSRSVIEFFEKSDSFLEPSFSLDILASELSLSKQEVSEVINQKMNSSFYQLVALYRIKYAQSLIGENKNLTIEAIVDECGFSSKSTFNKYFKYYVGQTPSVYRSALI